MRTRFRRILILLAFFGLSGAWAVPGVPVVGAELDHAELMVYRGADGELQPVKTPADWTKRRAQILAGMQ